MPGGRILIEFDPAEVRRLSGLGLTISEIASRLEISERTLYQRKADLAQFSQAWKSGKARAKEDTSNVLYQKAMEGDTACLLHFDKTRNRMSDPQEPLDVNHTGTLSIEQVATVARTRKPPPEPEGDL